MDLQASYDGAAPWDDNDVYTEEAIRQRDSDALTEYLMRTSGDPSHEGYVVSALGGAIMGGTSDDAYEIREYALQYGWKAALRLVAGTL